MSMIKITVIIDITHLVEFGCIEQIEGTQSRNIRYEINSWDTNIMIMYKLIEINVTVLYAMICVVDII